MANLYELSDFNNHTPFKCTIHHIGQKRPHMHDFFEIIFILTGSCNIITDDQLCQLNEGDILIVESHTTHELNSYNCIYVSLQLDQTALENNFPIPLHPSFECNSTFPGHEKEFQEIRTLLAQIVKNNADQQLGYELRNWIYVYQLMEILYMHFQVDDSCVNKKKHYRYASRVSEIINIIKTYYNQDLPLSRIADMVHLSTPYLSKFFQEQFGMNYLSYLTHFRINKAVHDLLNTDANIEEISANNGFPNSHAFTQAFRKEFDMLPSVYRRTQKRESNKQNYYGIEQHDYMSGLTKYLSNTTSSFNPSIPTISSVGTVSLLNNTKPLRHTWRNLLSIGKASDILLSDVQKILRRIQKEIHYEYLFFNGILSDDLYVYSLDYSGTGVYNFVYVDKILDFLLEIGLKPFLQFTYMPKDLAKRTNDILFGHLVSEPANLHEWSLLIQAFMNHILNRYQLSELRTWKFSVWHQPDTPSRLYGFDKTEDFYKFYKSTYYIVKGIHPDLCFGSPAFYYLDDPKHKEWHYAFLSWCSNHNCAPDFLNFIYYDTKLSPRHNKSKSTFGFVDSMILNESPNGVHDFIQQLKKDLRAWKYTNTPVYICEWNNTPSQQDLLNDTCYKSCYITKTILDNYDMSESLSYWSLTDLMSESPLSGDMLFGGLGLFTINGLPKANYYAFHLLSKLGDQFIGKGECWFATKTNSDIRIIAYHYRHYSKLYTMGERFEMTDTNRYAMFEPNQQLHLTLTLNNVPECQYIVQETILNRSSGSLFDEWQAMGGLPITSSEELELLEAKSMPNITKHLVNTVDSSLTLNLNLELLEVRLIILTPVTKTY